MFRKIPADSTYPAPFTHRDPREVVIIGGGDCGMLREVVKHAEARQVLQVEINERVTRLTYRKDSEQ